MFWISSKNAFRLSMYGFIQKIDWNYLNKIFLIERLCQLNMKTMKTSCYKIVKSIFLKLFSTIHLFPCWSLPKSVNYSFFFWNDYQFEIPHLSIGVAALLGLFLLLSQSLLSISNWLLLGIQIWKKSHLRLRHWN